MLIREEAELPFHAEAKSSQSNRSVAKSNSATRLLERISTTSATVGR